MLEIRYYNKICRLFSLGLFSKYQICIMFGITSLVTLGKTNLTLLMQLPQANNELPIKYYKELKLAKGEDK